MLVLKRKVGESIVIGEDIEVIILEQDGESVRIGIKAPRSVSVFRAEIYEEIKQENKNAVPTLSLEEIIKEYKENEKNDENKRKP